MNVRHALVAAAGAVALAATAQASEVGGSKKLGLGLSGGNVASGLSGKLFLTESVAVQGIVGGYVSERTFALEADIVQQLGVLARPAAGELVWGVGATAGLANALNLGGIGQLAFRFNAVPVELAAEWRPGVFLGGKDGGVHLFSAGSAVRWFF
jgi:hypothetical protein